MHDPHILHRLQPGVEHLHDLGPRAMAELFVELAGIVGGMATILALLNKYRRYSANVVHAVGGGRFPPRPVRVVPEGFGR